MSNFLDIASPAMRKNQYNKKQESRFTKGE